MKTSTPTLHWVDIGLTYGVQFTGVAGETVQRVQDDNGHPFATAGDATLYACHLRTIGRSDAHIVYSLTGTLNWRPLHNPATLIPSPAVTDHPLLHRIAHEITDHTDSAIDSEAALGLAALALGLAEHVVTASSPDHHSSTPPAH